MQRFYQAIRKLFRVTLAFLVVLVLPASDVHGGGTLPGGNVRISDAGAGGAALANVRITERDGIYYAVWEDDRDESIGFGKKGIYFARSTDGGESWSANRRVNNAPLEDWVNEPDIAIQLDGTIWGVWHFWEDETFANPNDVRIAKSTDGGASFQVSTLVDGEDEGRDRWMNRIVVDDSSGLPYVMVTEGDTEGFDFYLLRYGETTEQWSEPVLVNDVPRPGRPNPNYGYDYGVWFSLAARDGLICAAWEDRGRDLTLYRPI